MGVVKNNYYKPVDYDKLKRALKVRNMGVTEASVQIGRSKNYISGIKATGKISVSDALLVEKVLNVPYSEYEYQEPEPAPAQEEHKPEEPKEQAPAAIDYNQLYKTVYVAVYRAFTRAFNGEDINGRKA